MPLDLQTLMPAVVTPSSQKIVTDIDGDQVNELVILDSTLKQLSIVHQFTYGDFSLNSIDPDIWPASMSGATNQLWPDMTLRWWTVWATQQGVIPSAPLVTVQWGVEIGDATVAADFDGDGVDELFIYNRATGWWGILKWNPTTKQLETLYAIQIPPTVPVFPGSQQGDLTWRVTAADEYFVIPNVSSLISSASGAGFLAFNTQTLAMGLIFYSKTAGKLLQWWSLPAAAAGGALTGWTLRTDDQFYGANFTAPGTPSVAVLNRTTEYINLLTWNGSAFVGYSGQHNVGGWSFGSADQVHCADLDGDGVAEIFMYNNPGSGNTGFIGVLEWDNDSKQFQAPAVNHGQIGNAPPEWYVGGTDQYYCLNGTGGNPGPILAFAPDAVQLAILNYQSGNFTCKWADSTLSSSNAWAVAAADSFYARDPANTYQPALFTLSNQGPSSSTVFTMGAIGWNGTSFQVGSSARVPVLGWSPAFLAAAPPTSFTQVRFQQGDQPAIYTYISSLFPEPGAVNPPDNDVRAHYSNADDKGKFETYSQALTQINNSPTQVPSTWVPQPNSTWNQTDWQKVVNTIIAECEQVDTVYNMYDAIGKLSDDLNKFQTDDLNTVNDNVDQSSQSNPPSELDYWLGQVGIALLWGMAAAVGAMFPEGMAAEGAAFSTFFSMGASVAGSAFGYNPTQQQSYTVDVIEKEISGTAVQEIVGQSLNLTTFLTDPVKMKICDALHEGQWAMLTSLPATAEQPFSATDRLVMYQLLIPAYFSIVVATASSPLLTQVTYSLNGRNYMLKGSSAIPQSQWQSSLVYSDLITTLGVSEEDFFVGNGAWAAIPRQYVLPLTPPPS